jgi:hypothetical protein
MLEDLIKKYLKNGYRYSELIDLLYQLGELAEIDVNDIVDNLDAIANIE